MAICFWVLDFTGWDFDMAHMSKSGGSTIE